MKTDMMMGVSMPGTWRRPVVKLVDLPLRVGMRLGVLRWIDHGEVEVWYGQMLRRASNALCVDNAISILHAQRTGKGGI